MSAARIARALHGRRSGRGFIARCPVHDDRRPSLSISEGEGGQLLIYCHAGCDARGVLAELRRLGHLSSGDPPQLPPEEIARRAAWAERERRRKIAKAHNLWNQGQPITDTLGARYLRSRGLDALSLDRATVLAAIRYLPRAWHSPGIYRPAIVAAIEHVEHGVIGVHLTYLAMDGGGKTTLDPPRKIIGACKGGAVRFGEPRAAEWLVIAEGIETALSVGQSCGLSAWAALSASGIRSIELPAAVRMVLIAADSDKNGVGQQAALAAAQRFLTEGRRVRIALPPLGRDFNDLLTGLDPATGERAHDVAA